jgi:hypothetical protein
MKIVNIKTGFGYVKDASDNIVTKFELPIGDHSFKDEYTVVQVRDQAALDAIEVHTPPKSQKRINEEKIVKEMRKNAIAALKTRGELASDFVDPKG